MMLSFASASSTDSANESTPLLSHGASGHGDRYRSSKRPLTSPSSSSSASFFSNNKEPGPYVEFWERMHGQINHAVPLEFSVKIIIDDLNEFMNHTHDAAVFGTAKVPTLSPCSLTILNGRMQFFLNDTESIRRQQMRYELPMETHTGQCYTLVGIQNLCNDEHGLNFCCCFGGCGQAYRDTTRLECVIYEGDNISDDEGKIKGRGLLKMSFFDVVKMMFSFRGKGAARYKHYFYSHLAAIYWRAWLPKKTPLFTDAELPLQRETPKHEKHWVVTDDGEQLPLKRYQGHYSNAYGGAAAGANRPCQGVILCTAGLASSDLIYTLETIPQNFVETLTSYGFDVWTASLRFGRFVEPKNFNYTLDDVAQYDYPAIFDLIEKQTNPSTRKGGIHVHAQCLGAMTLTMSVLGGHLNPERVKSLVCSQLGVHIRPSFHNNLKRHLGVPTLCMATCGGTKKEYRAPRNPHRTCSDRFLDWIASYILPIPNTFRTDNVEQARIGLLFNEAWNSDQMDRNTIARMLPDIGTVNLGLYQHVMKCAKAGHAVNSKGEDVYLPNIVRLAQIPTTFQFGTDSGVFQRQAMEQDLSLFQDTAQKKGFCTPDGESLHRLVLAEGHGHLDTLVGKMAYETAYPDLVDHFGKWDKMDSRSWVVNENRTRRALLETSSREEEQSSSSSSRRSLMDMIFPHSPAGAVVVDENDIAVKNGDFEVTKDELATLRAVLEKEFPEDSRNVSDAYVRSVASKPYSKDKTKRRPLEYTQKKLSELMAWRADPTARVDSGAVGLPDLMKLANEAAPNNKTTNPEQLKQAQAIAKCLNNNSMYFHGFTKEGRPILWVRTDRRSWYPDVKADISAVVLVADTGIRAMPEGVTDFVAIIETSRPPPPHPTYMISVLETLVKGYPDRAHRIVAAPVGSIVQFVMKILHPLMPATVASKLCLCGTAEASTHISEMLLNGEDDLPTFFGGPADHDQFYPVESKCPNRGSGYLKFDYFGMVERMEAFRKEYEEKKRNGELFEVRPRSRRTESYNDHTMSPDREIFYESFENHLDIVGSSESQHRPSFTVENNNHDDNRDNKFAVRGDYAAIVILCTSVLVRGLFMAAEQASG